MQDKKLEMPLVEAMLKYKSEDVYPMHTPGHKGGRGMVEPLRQELLPGIPMDVSLMSELDDIHEPESYIKAGQDLAAKTYGSDACFWAVNGTSQAIHAMLMTALNPGEKLLLPRNAHRSVAGGIVLSGIEVVYMQPKFNADFGLQLQVTAEDIEQALNKDNDIKAVLITSPNYYGVAADVRAIADVCHKHGAVLLVDEAHGPHLGFSALLPPSALQCGADACSQSTHKLLGAMTQCSMLHVQGKYLDLQKAADVMSILTTTSPNYFLMASLDAARAQLDAAGETMAEQAVEASNKLRRLLKSFKGLVVLEQEHCKPWRLDTTKVTVNVSAWGYTGIEAGDLLRQARVAVELVDAQNVLFLVTYADANEDFAKALKRIEEVFQFMEKHKKPVKQTKAAEEVPVTKAVRSLRDVFYGKKAAVALGEAEGKICAEQVSFYPPGIPVLLPGELITKEIIDYCKAMKALGLPVSGPADSSLATVRVVMDDNRG